MNVSDDLWSSRWPVLRTNLFRRVRRACLVASWKLSGIAVAGYYSQLLHQHGRSPQALAERSDQKELQFYNQLFQGIGLPPQVSVLDIGCGMGSLIEYLQLKETRITSYLGIDIVGPFIDHCAIKYQEPYRFRCVNFVNRSFAPAEKFDLIVNMGTLVSRVFQYERYIEYCIKKMIALSKRDILFNIITEVDYSLGNYKNNARIGHITYIPKGRLVAILDKMAYRFDATFDIREVRVYPDATDTFVHIRLGG